MASFASQAAQAIPAEVHMISGSHDSQTSADVSNVGSFQLPDPAGRAGGACTSAILQILYKDHKNVLQTEQPSWVSVLRQMRDVLRRKGFDQIPQLTSSRMVDVNKPMFIVPPGCTGARRAILVGINYRGQQGQLSGCHNDALNVKEYLENVQGFREQDMIILMDDGIHHNPTRQNLQNAFHRVVQYTKPGDVVFVHYSGHGGRLRDDNGDEEDGYDETLIPVDFRTADQIRDDFLLEYLVRPLPAGSNMTCLMDCCHSGTVLDLPYRFASNEDHMVENKSVNFANLLGSPEATMAAACCLLYCLSMFLGGE